MTDLLKVSVCYCSPPVLSIVRPLIYEEKNYVSTLLRKNPAF